MQWYLVERRHALKLLSFHPVDPLRCEAGLRSQTMQENLEDFVWLLRIEAGASAVPHQTSPRGPSRVQIAPGWITHALGAVLLPHFGRAVPRSTFLTQISWF